MRVRGFIGVFILVLFTFSHAFGQEDWQTNIEQVNNLQGIIKAHDVAVKVNPGDSINTQDGPEEVYQRWVNFIGPRVKPDGTAYPPDMLYKQWLEFKKTKVQPSYKTGSSVTWQYSGPVSSPYNRGGDGRVNCIKFQPGNPNTIWAGVPSGGLWKSSDGGATWLTNTDNLPNLGVTDIAINPRNTDTMFIATGDGFGYPLGANFFGGTYSIGILRSTDGGNTWDTTGMTWSLTGSNQIFRLLIDPKNPNILLATANNGVWRTADAGNTWKKVISGTFKDVIANPLNPSEIFTTSISPTAIYKSSDTGKTWAALPSNSFNSSGPISLAMTPADTSVVYALLQLPSNSEGFVYKSNNGGNTWNYQGGVSSTTFYGWYTLAINVSPKDANTVYVGGIDLAKSTDGGLYFYQITTYQGTTGYDYDHPDHRVLAFYPGSGDTIYDGNDGGIFRSYNGGSNWNQISSGLQALEIYRIGSSKSEPELYYTGAQDNGVNQANNGTWSFELQGDGMECVVDFSDPKIAYGATQYGNLNKTTNSGFTWTYGIEPEKGQWTAPIVMDPQTPSTLFYGGDYNLYKSTDQGDNWTNISGSNSGMPYSRIAVAPANDNYIYVSQESDGYLSPIVFRYTKDGGSTWSGLANGLPQGNQFISGIAVEKSSPDSVYICLSGYNSGTKVFRSTDGGLNWVNISANLPNIPMDCILSEGSTTHGVYVGTDLGVFYLSDTSSNGQWAYYNNGLPNVIVDDMEIIPLKNTIRVATYGRGVWDGTLAGTLTSIETKNALDKEINILPNPSTGIFSISAPEYQGSTPAILVTDICGREIKRLSPSETNATEMKVDLTGYSSGIYTFQFIYPANVVVKKADLVK